MIRKSSYFVFAWLSIIIGVIGIFLPLLPTTPFILLAAFLFSKSSVRMHNWLITHKYLGPIIIDWEQHGAISLKAKWTSTISMLVLVTYPLLFVIDSIIIQAIVICFMLAVNLFIWTRPSKRTPVSQKT
uniref:YbaN family protein n=1 Tax=Ningiella ruwaisensis TaxID=2364274 RepID=UPI001F4F17B3|nr:YbaN family protein [Ningiella ruwaisensis]